MQTLALKLAVAALAALLMPYSGWAQDAPAIAKATGAEKERLKGLIEQAKKEGAVSYIDTLITPQAHDKLEAAFKKHYGLPASFQVGGIYLSPSAMITRLGQEMHANRVTFDVAAVASPAWVQGRLKEGKILKYASPEYANYKRALDEQMGLKDHFLVSAAYTFSPTWNTEITKFDGDSWQDMLRIPDLVPPGRFISSDCAVSDSTLMVYMGVRRVIDLKGWKKLADHKPNYTYKSEQTLSRLVSGEDLFALYGLNSHTVKFNKKGAKLKNLRPKEGLVLLPQVQFVLAGSPHPAAAKLWFDFVLSEEGQKIFMGNEYHISGRSGFKGPPEAPGLDDLPTIKMEWLKLTEDDLQKARDEWLTMFHGGKKRK
jgi:iron(III) transport system substrate-binding protein